jgi:hypothetical protein
MLHHIELGNTVFVRKRKLKSLIAKDKITLGGNKQLKILRNTAMQIRQKNENRKPCVFCFGKRSYQSGLQTLRTLHEKQISKLEKMDLLILQFLLKIFCFDFLIKGF